jgi:hypothetical protein
MISSAQNIDIAASGTAFKSMVKGYLVVIWIAAHTNAILIELI